MSQESTGDSLCRSSPSAISPPSASFALLPQNSGAVVVVGCGLCEFGMGTDTGGRCRRQQPQPGHGRRPGTWRHREN